MKFQSSRYFYVIPLVVLTLGQIMCNLPMKEEESVQLAEELLGLEIGEGLVYAVDSDVTSSQKEGWCSEYETPKTNRIESFVFSDGFGEAGKLTVITPDGKIVYKSFSDNFYCRTIAPDGEECIDFHGGNSNQYTMRLDVYPDGDITKDMELCYMAVHTLTLTNEEIPGIESVQNLPVPAQDSEPGENEALMGQDHVFTIDDCSCAGISVPLNADSSSASNNTYKMGILSGGQVEVTGHLTCDWQDAYQSENLSGTIRIYLNVSKFDQAQYAQTLFTELRNSIASNPQNCEAEPERCTVAIADFGEERAFYAHKNIYVGGRGELPSNHGAQMARLITIGEGKYYVLDMYVTHPELEMGNTWVIDTTQAVEQCVTGFINK